MDILGFDYDYTLASYTDRVQHFIYSNALRWLIEVQKLVFAMLSIGNLDYSSNGISRFLSKISKEFGSAAI
jgi:hypothetical protein